MSCASDVQPLQLKFSNNSVSTQENAFTNGVAIALGSPPQLFSLTPSTLLNNTYINSISTCGPNPNGTCLSVIGGGYSSSASSSFRASTIDAFNGSTEGGADNLIGQPALYFNDLLTVSANQLLPGFPALVLSGAPIYGVLGIGKNSTFINRLVEAAFAPSKAWSLFTGVYSNIGAGSLIIGGFAERFYTGELHTKNITAGSACAECFEVTGLDYIEGGSTVNLLANVTGSLNIFVDPYYPTLIVPDEVLWGFGNASRGTWSPQDYTHVYTPNNVPTGNISVTLGNGLKTTIPSSSLFDPPAYDNGVLALNRNQSVVYGLLNPWTAYTTGAAPTNLGIFGIPYSAMVYIIRDYEREQIKIANANQAAEITGNATTICPLDSSSGGGGSSHTGAIAGGVVGGIVGLLLIAFLGWFLWRRKKRGGKAKEDKTASADASEKSDDFVKAELPTYTTASPTTAGGDMKIQNDVSHPQGQPDHITQELPAEGANAIKEMPAEQATPVKELPNENKTIRAELPA